jgi:hypothetical protein
LDQDIEESNTSKEDIIKIKRSLREERSVACGLYVRGAPDCPVAHRTVRCHTLDSPMHQGTIAQRLVPGVTVQKRPPDCLV